MKKLTKPQTNWLTALCESADGLAPMDSASRPEIIKGSSHIALESLIKFGLAIKTEEGRRVGKWLYAEYRATELGKDVFKNLQSKR